MRGLSSTFRDDLLHQEGVLLPVFEKIKHDQTLMLAIRRNYINIYYRGGNLLRVVEGRKGGYQAQFDENYGWRIDDLPGLIGSVEDSKRWVKEIPILKNSMDNFFSAHPKLEREFQQLIARENNNSTISNESEYFITDIEFSDTNLHARIDLLGIRWSAKHRQYSNSCRAALMEMKYGDGVLTGSAGLVKHLRDFDALICDRERYRSLLEMMETQFNQLDQLGLLNFTRSGNGTRIRLNPEDKPEVIFILVNHNPRSTKLDAILADPEVEDYGRNPHFDLRFFVSSFAGYGLHSTCMLPLDQFRELLKRAN
jgi:hypothetical protein